MTVSSLVEISSVIGNGPSTPSMFARVIMFVLGVSIAILACTPNVRVRGAFMHGKGPSVPVGSAGRVILFTAGLVLLYVAMRGQ
jgi:hypothetical protein